MKINKERMLENLQRLIQTPSVVGYYPQIHALMEEILHELGFQGEYDRRRTLYVRVPGQSHEKTICMGAHLDTIGMIVRGVDDNGWLRVRKLGGISYSSLENENVCIHTRNHGTYEGMVICTSHSVHVFDDAREKPRTEENMRVLLDEEVSSAQDVRALGIRNGDLISVEPKYRRTPSGYIKSRHIDDKAQAAVLLECLALLKENNLKPAYDVLMAFPINEEIGQGGAYVPEYVDEYVALDIGLVGPDHEGSEKKVSIGAADRIAPYDWELTTKLVSLCEEAGIDYALDTFYHYASDATCALNAGRNLRHALFGAGCMNSHCYERTHEEGLIHTCQLAMAYLLAE